MFLNLFFNLLFVITTNNTTTVTVKVSNPQSEKGNIYMALYNSEDNFMDIDKASLKIIKSVNSFKSGVNLKISTSSEYAVVIFHDENNNGELDTNSLGIPKEGYAFSNNATGMFGPPSFDKASFQCTSGMCSQVLELNY